MPDRRPSDEFADIRITGPSLTILIVVPLLAVGLGWFLNRTAIGKAVKASADNPDLARLAGISPKTVSTLVWAIAGGLATLSLSSWRAPPGRPRTSTTSGPAP